MTRDPRRTFGPVVLAGLAGAGLAAVGGSKQWIVSTAEESAGTHGVSAEFGWTDGLGDMPAAGALALVALACWGVLLVTRGLVRRVVAVLALLAALATAVVSVTGLLDLRDSVPEALARAGVQGEPELGTSAWFWVTLLGAVVAVLAAAAAVRLTPRWPEMGRRYDAPAGAAAAAAASTVPLEERSSIELWNSIGEGEDPTSDETPDTSAPSTGDPLDGPRRRTE